MHFQEHHFINKEHPSNGLQCNSFLYNIGSLLRYSTIYTFIIKTINDSVLLLMKKITLFFWNQSNSNFWVEYLCRYPSVPLVIYLFKVIFNNWRCIHIPSVEINISYTLFNVFYHMWLVDLGGWWGRRDGGTSDNSISISQ